jgi:DNA-binding transcriptional LysR family regulator
MHISAIDTHLVVALHALLETESVARAARRVGLSPSATSHALARLRDLFADPLLARAGRRLVRTPRGDRLLEETQNAVRILERIFSPAGPLEPKTLTRAFRIATTDHVQLVLLRELDRLLVREAPSVDLYCVPMDRGTYAELRDGPVDLSIGVFDEPPPDILRAPLFVDRLTTAVRAGHPLLHGAVTLDRFVDYQHVLVAPLGSPVGLVDALLTRRKRTRRIARTLPTFMDAALLVSETDYVVSLPRTVVAPLARALGLRILSVPLALPRFTISMAWHRRHDADPEHRFLRDTVVRAARSAIAPTRPLPYRPPRATNAAPKRH